MSKKLSKKYQFKVGTLTLLTTSLGAIGLAQNVHAASASSLTAPNASTETRDAVPDVNADPSTAHIQISTQSQTSQVGSAAQTSSETQSSAVRQTTRTSVVSAEPASSAVNSSSNNSSWQSSDTRAISSAQPVTRRVAKVTSPFAPTTSSPVKPSAANTNAGGIRPASLNTKASSVPVRVLIASKPSRMVPGSKSSGVASTSQPAAASGSWQSTSEVDNQVLPIAQPVRPAKVSVTRSPKKAMAVSSLSGVNSQPIVGNEKHSLTGWNAQTNLATARVADTAKVGPATNLIASTQPAAIGKNIIANLSDQKVGQQAIDLIAKAVARLPVKTGYATISQQKLGQTVKQNLSKLMTPITTTVLPDVSDVEFKKAAQNAQKVYDQTGVPQVVTRSSTVTTEAPAAVSSGLDSGVNKLLDPSGGNTAVAQIVSNQTTAAAATQATGLLGDAGTQLKQALGDQLAPTSTNSKSIKENSIPTEVVPAAQAVNLLTRAAGTPTINSNFLGQLASALTPANIVQELANAVNVLTNIVQNGISTASSNQNILSKVLNALGNGKNGKGLKSFIAGLGQGNLVNSIKSVLGVFSEDNSSSGVPSDLQSDGFSKVVSQATDDIANFFKNIGLSLSGNPLNRFTSENGKSGTVPKDDSKTKSNSHLIDPGDNDLQELTNKVSDAVKGLTSSDGVLGKLIGAVKNHINPLTGIAKWIGDTANNLKKTLSKTNFGIGKATLTTNTLSPITIGALGANQVAHDDQSNQRVTQSLPSAQIGRALQKLLANTASQLSLKLGYAPLNPVKLGQVLKDQLLTVNQARQSAVLENGDELALGNSTQASGHATDTDQLQAAEGMTAKTVQTEISPNSTVRNLQASFKEQLAPVVSTMTDKLKLAGAALAKTNVVKTAVANIISEPTSPIHTVATLLGAGSNSSTATSPSVALALASAATPTDQSTTGTSNSLGELIDKIKAQLASLADGTSKSNSLWQNVSVVAGNLINKAGDLIQQVTGIHLDNTDWKKAISDWVAGIKKIIDDAVASDPGVQAGLKWYTGIQNALGPLYDGLVRLVNSFSISQISSDFKNLIKLPSLSGIWNQAGEILKQQLNSLGLPGLSSILGQGAGKATESGNSVDIFNNVKNTVNNSIIGTTIGTLTNQQAQAQKKITWVNPDVTDRDKYLRKDGKLTTTLNPDYGKKLFAKGVNDPAYVAENTGYSSDPTLEKTFGENNSFDVADMLKQDHSATAPQDGSWELDGPDEMTPDHRYLTTIRIMPEVSGLGSIGNLSSSTTSMKIICPYLLGQGTLTSLSGSDSEPLKDGFNARGWAPVIAYDSGVSTIDGLVQGGTLHTPAIDQSNGDFGVWLRIQYPTGVDARSMAESIDWWSGVNAQQATLGASLGILPATLVDWSLEWMPRYTSWSPDDPNATYFLIRGKKAGGADWNKIENVNNVGGINSSEVLNGLLHSSSFQDIINAIRNISFLTPQSYPIDGTMIPDGALGLWGTVNRLLGSRKATSNSSNDSKNNSQNGNQNNDQIKLPSLSDLGIVVGLGTFNFNVNVDRYRGNYSTKQTADILQAQGKIKNANDTAEVNAYRAQHPQAFYGVDDTEGKLMTQGIRPPSGTGRLNVSWTVLDNGGYTRDPQNANPTDVANAAIRTNVRDFQIGNTTNATVTTWHNYLTADSGAMVKLNRAVDGSLTDQSDGGRTMVFYGKSKPASTDKPVFQVKDFFTKLAGNGDTPLDTDVTQDFVSNGLKTITLSTNASKASGNVGSDGQPSVVNLKNLDVDPGDLKTGTANVYDDVIHINGTGLDGSYLRQTLDLPIQQTVNGVKILNQASNGASVSASSTFSLSGRTRSNELKRGNTAKLQYKVDEIDNDGKVIKAGKWTDFPDKSGTINISSNWSNFKLPMGSLNLQNGHKYRISYQAIDAYGFKTNSNASTTMTVGLKSGYSFAYKTSAGVTVLPTRFVTSTNTNNQIDLNANKVLIDGYVLKNVLVNGISQGTVDGTVTINPAIMPVITYVYQKV